MSKWIKKNDGHYKLVPDDYDQKEDVEFVKRKDKEFKKLARAGQINITLKFTPLWREPLRKIDGINNPKNESRMVEAMDIERQKETSVSSKARAWEKSRKAELTKYKPQWVKRGRVISELKQISK